MESWGLQPRTARKFFDKYQDRILFGTDATPHGDEFPQQVFNDQLYEIYYRFLETDDEYFDYAPARVPPQGRWRIYGIDLPEPIYARSISKTRRDARHNRVIIHRECAMCFAVIFCALVLVLARMTGAPVSTGVFESVEASGEVAPSTDPNLPFWTAAHPVFADRGTFGQPRAHYRTEIRYRLTENNLGFLFICPLRRAESQTVAGNCIRNIWARNWDVAEVFIGSDFQNIRRYEEFEISPQGEWIDLDIDLNKPHHEDGWKWNSGLLWPPASMPVPKLVWSDANSILRSSEPSRGDE